MKNETTSNEHLRRVHGDGSECVDGCDAAPLPFVITISAWHLPKQSADGRTHLTYYAKPWALSFVWDGESETIEVSHGGYAEPVLCEIPARCGVKHAPRVVGDGFGEYCFAAIPEIVDYFGL